jgi:hypothetical protein
MQLCKQKKGPYVTQVTLTTPEEPSEPSTCGNRGSIKY